MFDQEFYPTPIEVVERMLSGIDVCGKVILEPSAGKGDIIDILKQRGASVIACELHSELAIISAKKADVFLTNDFFDVKPEDISHVNFIIMNPPFSNADKHILHAYEIAPGGCTIISLCNYSTIEHRHSRNRIKLYNLIHDNGNSSSLGNVFDTAERKTDVEVGLISLYKPKAGDDEFADYLFSDEEEPEYNQSGIFQYSYIRDIVGRYIQGCKLFESVINSQKTINEVIKPLGGDFDISFRAINENKIDYGLDYERYKKTLQKSAWRAIFNKMKMDKYLTSSTLSDVNRFVEQQTNKPFTMKNIETMLQIIVGTHGSRMDKVIEEVFDWLTDRHHDNRKDVEGWKTNSMYMVNQKFIAPYSHVSKGYNGKPEISWSNNGHKIDELVKAICFITGKNYDNMTSIRDFFTRTEVKNEEYFEAINEAINETGLSERICSFWHSNFRYFNLNDREKFHRNQSANWINAYDKDVIDKLCDFYESKKYPTNVFLEKIEIYKDWGTWYEWTFFKIKVFKKGTFHCQFLDEKVWEMFNKAAIKAKGWRVPERTGSDIKRKGTEVARA